MEILGLLGKLGGWKGYAAAAAVAFLVGGYAGWEARDLFAERAERLRLEAKVIELVAVNANNEAVHAQQLANLEANLAALNRVAAKEAEERERLEGVVEALASIDPAEDCTGGPGFDHVIDMLWGETTP